ncbi:hypothetical protein LVJ94_31405 [Pendulispora rubella]|uniref:Tetratricopeptide repeat protein n=1 Tax=Pendulispora rubella TaxID=2741070 RepID=A0ABZ2KSB2_9BACT
MSRRLLIFALAACTIASGASVARADDTTAEALFRAGKQASERGDFKTACEKFEQSQQLEPAPGTLLNLADCEEHLGRLGLAAQHFRLAVTHFRPSDPRVPYAKERAATAESHMARLSLRVTEGAPPQTRVFRDGIELDPQALGQPLRVDPGEHTVMATAPGKGERTYTIRLLQGETKELAVVPSDAPPVVAPLPPKEEEPKKEEQRGISLPRSSPVTLREAEEGPSRTLGWIALGVGGAGLAIGSIFGLQAISKKSTIDSHCNATCDPEGYDAERSFDRASLWSTVGFGAALVGIGAGTYFLVARPFDRRVLVSTQPAHAGLTLHLTTEF